MPKPWSLCSSPLSSPPCALHTARNGMSPVLRVQKDKCQPEHLVLPETLGTSLSPCHLEQFLFCL